MPRALLNPPRTVSIDLGQAPRVTRLRSTPRDGTAPPIPSAQILREKVTPYPPRQDLNRTRYGRALNLDRIEQALRAADSGSMRLLTDLSRETVDTDPHLAAVLGKRFGAVSALPWELVPASGFGIEKDRAQFYADVVRDQIKQLPNFSQRINQLAWGLFDGRSALENQWLNTLGLAGLPTITSPFGTVRWMVRDLVWIHPRRLQFGPQRELRLDDTQSGGNFSQVGEALDAYPMKFIQFMPQLFGDYQEREGLSRRCLYWSFFKRSSARERMMLMELFGKPWRWLEVDEDSTADSDDLAAADEQLQQLGGLASFRFPRGTKLNVEQPAKGAGDVHQAIIEESDKQLSKLVLGQTGTTDSAPAGLNNVQANVMQDEQFMLLVRDSRLLSEAIETYLTDAIIELNFGPESVTHAPHFVLRADVPLDRTKEIGRLDAAVKAGLEVPLSEAYELSGFRVPRADEPVIKLETPPLHPLAVQPNPERPVIVYPAGWSLPSRETQPIAPPGPGGLVSPTKPPGNGGGGVSGPPGGAAPAPKPETAPTPDDPALPSAADKPTVASRWIDAEAGHTGVTLRAAHPSDAAVMRAVYAYEAGCTTCSINLEDADDEDNGELTPEEAIAKAAQPIDKGDVGSVETVVERGAREGARASAGMANTFVTAVRGLSDARSIVAALDAAMENQNLQPLTRSIERRVMQGVMSGSLASHYEATTDSTLPAAKFAATPGQTVRNFVERPYAEALRWFSGLNVVSKNEYTRLEASAKRRAFTIANVHNARQLDIAKEELTRQMKTGASLQSFSDSLSDRFTLAGMTTLNPSHVETVYRTNIVNAYNSGRHAQMTSPAMLRARPYWQVRTVNDGPPRQRATHQKLHNWVIAASDPVWKSAFPPFGFNCRCRVVSRSQTDVDNLGLTVHSGSEVSGVPDTGFTSGSSALL